MTILPLLLFGLLFYNCAIAQNTKSIIVKTGTSINEGVPAEDLYQYSQFIYGKVFFRNGTSSNTKLNYNRFLDEMQFINANGDTLTIDNEETIRLISVNSDSFYYDKGYIMLISDSNLLKLAIRQGLKILDKQKKSAYDMSTSISSIRSVNSYSGGERVYKVPVTEDVLLTQEVYYYFGDEYNHFVLANKKNLLELFPKYSQAIRKYVKEKKIDFQKKDDLEKLLQFIALL